MSNLENSIKDCIAKELESGVIEKVIATQLEKCVEKAISDMFSWGGDVKKVVEEKVKSVMVPYLESYDYSQYIVKLDSVMTEVLKNSTLENKTILNNFKSLMTDIPEKIKMSDILTEWGKYCEKVIDTDDIEMDCEGGYITVTLDTEEVSSSWSSYERYMVRLECEEDEDLRCEFEISKWKEREEPFSLNYGGVSDIRSLRRLKDFELYLMKISQGHENIIMDIENDSEDVFIEYQG